jgi:hypothetical protein
MFGRMRRMSLKTSSTRLGLAILVLGCTACDGIVGVETGTPSLPMDVLRGAPVVASVGSQALVGEAFLWRDFMPGQDDTRLRAVVGVSTEDASPFPDGASISRLWVLGSATVWETDELRLPPEISPYQLKRSASGGPKWETGLRVDVVVEVRGVTDEFLLLRVPDVEIVRTS